MNAKQLDNLRINLPKNPNILKKRLYFNSAVIIPIIKDNGQYCFLFELRAKGIHQEGEICFPGGRYESDIDKSFLDCAIRETVEELGISKDVIQVLGGMDTLITPYGVTVDSFPAFLNIDFKDIVNYDKKEVEEIFTIPISFFINNKPATYSVRVEITPFITDENGNNVTLVPVLELGLPPRYSKTWHSKKHPVLAYKTDKYIIWGITANLIHEAVYLMELSGN
ncbi:MAG: CoA pyrophosphatase [bacterium]